MVERRSHLINDGRIAPVIYQVRPSFFNFSLQKCKKEGFLFAKHSQFKRFQQAYPIKPLKITYPARCRIVSESWVARNYLNIRVDYESWVPKS